MTESYAVVVETGWATTSPSVARADDAPGLRWRVRRWKADKSSYGTMLGVATTPHAEAALGIEAEDVKSRGARWCWVFARSILPPFVAAIEV